MNDIARVISKLEQQRATIDHAISALKSLQGDSSTSARITSTNADEVPAPKRRRRRLTAAGRKKIAEAVRNYWAKKKAAAEKTKKPQAK